MRMTKYTSWAVAVGLALSAAPAFALTINDAGVVGTIEAGTGNGSNASNETDWSNYLLSLGANATVTTDADTPPNGNNETYKTGSNDYNATLSTGTQSAAIGDNDPIPNVAGSQYALVKYDGPNAGYVLYNVADFDGGSGNLPEFSYSIWGKAEQYRVSHVTTFGGKTTTVPDGGATLILLGAALSGLGAARRFMKS
jgi:hypothetical protein